MSKPILFTGSGVALVTPMHPDGSINYEKLEQLVDWHVDAGTDALIVCGTTGEAPTLKMGEHLEAIRVAVSGRRVVSPSSPAPAPTTPPTASSPAAAPRNWAQTVCCW